MFCQKTKSIELKNVTDFEVSPKVFSRNPCKVTSIALIALFAIKMLMGIIFTLLGSFGNLPFKLGLGLGGGLAFTGLIGLSIMGAHFELNHSHVTNNDF